MSKEISSAKIVGNVEENIVRKYCQEKLWGKSKEILSGKFFGKKSKEIQYCQEKLYGKFKKI